MQKRTLLLSFGAFVLRPANALYDPKPIALLEMTTGSWEGSLTYRDYQKPDRMVALKTAVTVSLVAPDELALYYVFDDGPGKIVYSYERMKFDLVANQLIWNSGTSKPSLNEYKITSSRTEKAKSTLTFEKSADAGTDRYSFEIDKKTWVLTKYEIAPGVKESLRSKYEFSKREA